MIDVVYLRILAPSKVFMIASGTAKLHTPAVVQTTTGHPPPKMEEDVFLFNAMQTWKQSWAFVSAEMWKELLPLWRFVYQFRCSS